MVGRRYRDVLEASTTVKRLNEVSVEIVQQLAATRNIVATDRKQSEPEKSAARKLVKHRFILLTTILPAVSKLVLFWFLDFSQKNFFFGKNSIA